MDNLLSSLIALETEKREICIRLGDTKQKISEKLNEFELDVTGTFGRFNRQARD